MEPEILVVDDDIAIRETLRLVLEDEGYQVIEARDGQTALHILRERVHPLVVLLDQVMPVLDGAGVLRAAAADPAIAGAHAFILVTASSAALDAGLEQEAGSLLAGVVAKPFDLDALLQTIAAAVGRVRFATMPAMEPGEQTSLDRGG